MKQAKSLQTNKVSAFDKRIHEIDFFRGFLILLVIMDHLFLNIYHLNLDIPFFKWYVFSDARTIIQPIALMAFCFVSGVSCLFSKNNWKRAIECLILWALIVIGSNVIQLLMDHNIIPVGNDPKMRVDLNIIGVLGFSMLVYCFVQKRDYKSIIIVILISYFISSYFIPYLRINLTKLCGSWENNRPGCYFPSGTPNFYFPFFWESKGQADYVPLFPYIMFFFLGCLFSYYFYKDKKKSLIKYKGNWEKPICFLGRYTLIIYLAQFVVLAIIFNIIKACI